MSNRLHDAFVQVEASDRLKASTLQYLQDQRQKRAPKPGRFAPRRAVLAVCMALLLFVGIGALDSLRRPTAYISIDINPSIELALNGFDRVVSATAYNDDGQLVLAQADLKGKLYTEAIDLLLASEAMQPYLTADSALTFTVAAADSGKEDRLLAGIQGCEGCQRHGGQGYGASVELLSEAHSQGFSLGKYSAYLALLQYDDTVTAEACQNMTMAQIRTLLHGYEGGGGEQHGSGCGHQNGGGWRNGSGSK